MTDENDIIKQALDSKLIEKVYDDGFSPTLKEASKIPVDLVKVARLVLAPIQLLGAFQDRLELIVERISQRVDPSKITPVDPYIAGPILQNLKYLSEKSILTECFINLLCRAIDKDRKNEAHPGFIKVIENLSPDEVLLLYILSKRELEIVDTMEYDAGNNRFWNRKEEKSEIPKQELQYPFDFQIYYTHLDALGLVTWPVYKQEPIFENDTQTGIRRFSKLALTDYGSFFVKACVPDDDYVKERISEFRKK